MKVFGRWIWLHCEVNSRHNGSRFSILNLFFWCDLLCRSVTRKTFCSPGRFPLHHTPIKKVLLIFSECIWDLGGRSVCKHLNTGNHFLSSELEVLQRSVRERRLSTCQFSSASRCTFIVESVSNWMWCTVTCQVSSSVTRTIQQPPPNKNKSINKFKKKNKEFNTGTVEHRLERGKSSWRIVSSLSLNVL